MLALVAAPFAAGMLAACEQPACDAGRDVYETMLAPVTITQGATLQVPIVLLTAERPTTSTWITFQIPTGCAQAAATGSIGTYRLLDASAQPIDGATSMSRSMSEWCTPNAFGTGMPVPALPPSVFTCDALRCQASLTLEVVPSSTVVATELEAQLRDVSTSCRGEAPIPSRFRAHIEQFGE